MPASNPSDRFYFYHSSIGDLEDLIKKYSIEVHERSVGFITNAFGVKVNPRHFPSILTGKEGTIEPLPIPANWHADIAEFGSALHAVDLAEHEFTIVELGCGWGCWLNITGVVAKRKGLRVNLIGIEGDEGHVEFAHESLAKNGFNQSEYKIYHGVASGREGVALFPIQDQPGESWGLDPIFDSSTEESKKLLKSGKYRPLKQITLESLFQLKSNRVDLLHVDIQGGETDLVRNSLNFLDKNVAMMLIGTHSRSIEGDLIDFLTQAGWILEVERPAILTLGESIATIVDGVQLWRNPKIIKSDRRNSVDSSGVIKFINSPAEIRSKEFFEVLVEVENKSSSDWSSSAKLPVSLCYHWLDDKNDYVIFDGIRTKFDSGALKQKSKITQSMKIEAPNRQGVFQLIVTIVQDGVRWFDGSDFISDSIDIKII